MAEDTNSPGRKFHLASIYFSTSQTDVMMRLTVLDDNEEIVNIEGKGCVVLPAVLFLRTVTNVVQSQAIPRPTSRTGGGEDLLIIMFD